VLRRGCTGFPYQRRVCLGGNGVSAACDRQERTGIVEYGVSGSDVADTHSVVDQCSTSALGVPSFDISNAHLQFERGRHTIHGFDSVVLCVLSMVMQVDESGRNDQPGRIQHRLAFQRLCRDGFDSP
jgi:hypothetical protein